MLNPQVITDLLYLLLVILVLYWLSGYYILAGIIVARKTNERACSMISENVSGP